MKKDQAHSFEKESSINVILLTRYSDRKGFSAPHPEGGSAQTDLLDKSNVSLL